MAVLDEGQLYGQRMLHYLNKKEQFPFETILFTDVEEVKEYGKKQTVHLLLLDKEYEDEELKHSAEQIVVLSDNLDKAINHFPTVYRFQSVDTLIKEVMQYYEVNMSDSGFRLKKTGNTVKLVGVYSPLHRCLKTSFALTYGMISARNERVLYLSLETFSGFEYLMNQTFGADFSDVIFYQQQGSLANRLTGIVYTVGQMDYIPPVRCSEDLWSIDCTLFLECLHTLMDSALYDTIVLDMGEGFGRPEVLMNLCNLIYMPIKEDFVSKCRLEEFKETMKLKGYDLLFEKIQKINLPYYHCFEKKQLYVEQLLWGELGDYVRNLLKV